jgi:hypothetical protein
MSILKILGKVAKGAVQQTIGVNLDLFKKGGDLGSKSEQKTHEITVLITQLITSIIMLWKLLRGSKKAKSIENLKR